MPSPEVVTVYFDYLCPYAWRGAELAEMVAQELDLAFTWRHFSLYQSNHSGADNWQLWNDRLEPESDNGGKGLLPFLASCAARRQGPERHHAFRLALMRARHCNHKPLDRVTTWGVAEHVGLDMARFEDDFANPECRTTLAREHYQAKALEVFGTPTFQFEDGHLAYLRIRELPGPREALELFTDYRRMLECYPYLETIRRPRPRDN